MFSRDPRDECMDCGEPALELVQAGRCKRCLLRYQIQVFLLRKFLAETPHA
jgi:hypothetical protein